MLHGSPFYAKRRKALRRYRFPRNAGFVRILAAEKVAFLHPRAQPTSSNDIKEVKLIVPAGADA